MSSPRTVRVALLMCTELSDINEDYYDIFCQFLNGSLPPNSNTKVVIDGFDTVNEMKYPKEERISEYDMIMLSGSVASAYENLEWINRLIAFVQHVARDHPKVKIYGICFGHQVVCRALGGKCVRNGGRWEAGPTTVQLTGLGKSIFGVENLNLQQMHQDHIPLDSLSKPLASKKLHLIGSTPMTGNQGFVKFYPDENHCYKSPEQIHIITLQGHPEFNERIMTALVRRWSALGILGAAIERDYFGKRGDRGDTEPRNKEGTGTRWWRNDGVDIVGRVFWKILGVGSG